MRLISVMLSSCESCTLPFNNLVLHCVLLLTWQLHRFVSAIEIDNGVIGQPTISCGTDQIMFWVKTRNPFSGKVYVKGEYGRPECSQSFDGQTTGGTGGISGSTPITSFPPDFTCPPCQCPGGASSGGSGFGGGGSGFGGNRGQQYSSRFNRQQPPQPQVYHQQPGGAGQFSDAMAHLNVALGTCNIKRDRSLSPAGVQVTFTVVVSFHEHFVTKVDRAYKIQCAYMEADKTVTSEIDVSMPPTEEITQTGNMPQCEYTIRRDSPEGPPIQFAKVGDKVYHRWECHSEMRDMFGMLVHDCFVEDGQGQRVQVVDDRGCSIDQFVLPDLRYDSSLLAFVEAHVFKFADRAVLDFQCAISICVKQDGGCDGITPPRCANNRAFGLRLQKRSIVLETVNRTLPPPIFGPVDANEWRLHAQRFTVVDLDDDIKSEELESLENEIKNGNNDGHSDEHADSKNMRGRLSYYRRLLQRLGPRVCLSIAGFGVLVSLCTFVFTMAAVVIGGVYVLRRRKA